MKVDGLGRRKIGRKVGERQGERKWSEKRIKGKWVDSNEAMKDRAIVGKDET